MDVRLLIVDNAVHRHLFKPSWHWKAHLDGVNTYAFNMPSRQSVPALDRFSHVVLSGSEASVLQPEPWFEPEIRLIRDAVDRGLPILGSCFGHQLLVAALSGAEYLQPSNPPEVGWTEIEKLGDDPLFDGLPNPWGTFVYHFDEVIDPPAPWIKLGRTEHCDTHALRYGDLPVWGIQAHPEISSRKARFFMQAAFVLGKTPMRDVIRVLRTIPPRNEAADRILERFFAIPVADD
jgi:GMP synthase-like glutamine amidotransferase